MPKDRITQSHQGYGFVEFMGEEDADYAIKIMNMIKLYGKPIRVNKVSTKVFSLPFMDSSCNINMLFKSGFPQLLETLEKPGICFGSLNPGILCKNLEFP